MQQAPNKALRLEPVAFYNESQGELLGRQRWALGIHSSKMMELGLIELLERI